MMPDHVAEKQRTLHGTTCAHCHHKLIDKHEVTVTFDVNILAGHPLISKESFVDAIKDMMPDEWWWGANEDPWGVVDIRP